MIGDTAPTSAVENAPSTRRKKEKKKKKKNQIPGRLAKPDLTVQAKKARERERERCIRESSDDTEGSSSVSLPERSA
jgi:hypothetical protein